MAAIWFSLVHWRIYVCLSSNFVVTFYQWWAKLLRLLTVNSLSYFVKIKY
jgi:hypothetical protein